MSAARCQGGRRRPRQSRTGRRHVRASTDDRRATDRRRDGSRNCAGRGGEPGLFRRARRRCRSRGRDFGPGGDRQDETAVLVNERFATLHFPGRTQSGNASRVAADPGAAAMADTWWASSRTSGSASNQAGAVPIVYAPLLAASPVNATLYIRGTGDGAALTGAVRESLRQLDSLVPLDRARSLDARDPRRHVGLAGVGHARQHGLPVGVRAGRGRALRRRLAPHGAPAARDRLRMALGADAGHIARLVVGTVGGAVALGLVLGLLGVAAWDRAFAPAGPEGRAVESRQPGRGRRRAPAHRGARLPRAGGPRGPDRAGRSAPPGVTWALHNAGRMHGMRRRLTTRLAALLVAAGRERGRRAGRGADWLPVPGSHLYYEVHGSGPPVVLIHGGNLDAGCGTPTCRCWRSRSGSSPTTCARTAARDRRRRLRVARGSSRAARSPEDRSGGPCRPVARRAARRSTSRSPTLRVSIGWCSPGPASTGGRSRRIPSSPV